MNKKMVLIIVILIISLGFLSGCVDTTNTNESKNENNDEIKPSELNLGDSVISGNIKITFLTVEWTSSIQYKLTMKCENIGLEYDCFTLTIINFEMENGYKYSNVYKDDRWILTRCVNPGKNQTEGIAQQGLIDTDFLPVAYINLTIKTDKNPSPIEIKLNVL